jgi:enoyl-CoA hydratase/carnithine racemase
LYCSLPAIAAANHAAFGHCCKWALAVDLFNAANPKRLSLAVVTRGTHPCTEGRQDLARACVLPMAKEITLTGLHSNAWDVALLNFNEDRQPAFTEQ